MWKRLSFGLALLFLCGCFKTKDELTINADGSGKVRLETHSSIPPEMTQGMSLSGEMGGAIIYPPASEDEARKFFPGKDFKVSVKQDRADNGEITTVIEVEFKDLNALLASPYGKAHQLQVKIEDGALVLKGITAMEAAARFAEMKDEDGMRTSFMPGLGDLQKKKDEMRSEFRVTLPNAITSANGTRDGRTAAWIVERAKCKDAEDFARQLGVVAEARCPAEGLKLNPVSPVRLALQPFAGLAAGAASAGGPALDTNKIAAAVKFVPYGLSVTRSVDLSGGGGRQESGAQLVGAIVVPREFAPQKWGDARLQEATDAKGNSLKLRASGDDSAMDSMRYRFSGMEGDDEENSSTNDASEQRHVVVLAFRPPDWKINEIARIKGAVSLQYFGGSTDVVKLTNAVPANWLMDMKKAMSGRDFNMSEKRLPSPRLAELGVSLSLQMAMVQNGMTMLTLQVEGKGAALTDAQVFDAEGKPWPTILQQQDTGEESACQIIVAGKPAPPFSLALLASGGGSTVEVPILLEHVAINSK